MSPRRVCIVGSGNWGSAISRLVGANAAANPDLFHPTVNMWVFEETVNGKKLTEIINTTHENVKYLPGRKLPENVVAVPDIVQAAADADVLGRDSMMIASASIFVIPHQFMERALSPLKGKLREGAVGISLIKGFMIVPGGGIKLMSETITGMLGIPVGVLMGANLAGEVAADQFCETTIAFNGSKEVGSMFKKAFQTDNFRVSVVRDVHGTEMCGALKNIVACGAGFVDGLKLGDNTKAALIRIGLMEMIKYARMFGDNPQESTFLESCGVADLITTCYGGRNRRCSEAFVSTGKSIEQLEKEMLNGQRLQGPETALEVNMMLKAKGKEEEFPLFTAVHRVFMGEIKPEAVIDALRNHPVHRE